MGVISFRRKLEPTVRQIMKGGGGIYELTLCGTMFCMKHGTFPIILLKEKEGGYSVANLAFEGCYSQGETVEEAVENIKEATLLCLEDDETPIVAESDVSLHLVTV